MHFSHCWRQIAIKWIWYISRSFVFVLQYRIRSRYLFPIANKGEKTAVHSNAELSETACLIFPLFICHQTKERIHNFELCLMRVKSTYLQLTAFFSNKILKIINFDQSISNQSKSSILFRLLRYNILFSLAIFDLFFVVVVAIVADC